MFKLDIVHQEKYSRVELLLRTFFGWLYIMIPHGIALMFVGMAAGLLTFVAWWAILITGKYPRSLFDFMLGYYRWSTRFSASILNMADGYPRFGFDAHEDDAVIFDLEYPEHLSRGLLLLKTFFGFFYVLIPHMIVLMILIIPAYFIILIAWFAVLFTGKYPKGMFNYMLGITIWSTRVNLYFIMTDKYPPFSMKL